MSALERIFIVESLNAEHLTVDGYAGRILMLAAGFRDLHAMQCDGDGCMKLHKMRESFSLSSGHQWIRHIWRWMQSPYEEWGTADTRRPMNERQELADAFEFKCIFCVSEFHGAKIKRDMSDPRRQLFDPEYQLLHYECADATDCQNDDSERKHAFHQQKFGRHTQYDFMASKSMIADAQSMGEQCQAWLQRGGGAAVEDRRRAKREKQDAQRSPKAFNSLPLWYHNELIWRSKVEGVPAHAIKLWKKVHDDLEAITKNDPAELARLTSIMEADREAAKSRKRAIKAGLCAPTEGEGSIAVGELATVAVDAQALVDKYFPRVGPDMKPLRTKHSELLPLTVEAYNAATAVLKDQGRVGIDKQAEMWREILDLDGYAKDTGHVPKRVVHQLRCGAVPCVSAVEWVACLEIITIIECAHGRSQHTHARNYMYGA